MIFVHVFIPCGNLILQNTFVGSRCATVTLDAPPNQRISKLILDYPSGSLLVQVKPMSWCLLWLHASQWGLRNNIEFAGSTLLPFVVGNVPLLSPLLSVKYALLWSTHVCITLCHARIIYILSTSVGMSMTCCHLGINDHPMANDTCREALDMIYECVAMKYWKHLHQKIQL